MSAATKPPLAITMGDAAGVGPEVIVGAWGDERIHRETRPLVVGHPEVLRRAVRLVKRKVEVVELPVSSSFDAVVASREVLSCVKACDDEVLDVAAGRVDARAGEAAYRAVQLAAKWAIEGKVAGIVTAPLSKAALHAAGHKYPGHTELLAEICGVSEFAMMLYLPPGDAIRSPAGLGVAHVTLHQSLRSVFDDLTPNVILSKCRLADTVMRRLGVSKPRLAVCALNPHAGEDGLFGDEEHTIIAPAVDEARRAGMNVSGPFPTDTLMMRARDGEFDAVVAMYHDQGHIALKLLARALPMARHSTGHGKARPARMAWLRRF
jgi:4-hydroxythreonine-4-phosphate dehydrogenase